MFVKYLLLPGLCRLYHLWLVFTVKNAEGVRNTAIFVHVGISEPETGSLYVRATKLRVPNVKQAKCT